MGAGAAVISNHISALGGNLNPDHVQRKDVVKPGESLIGFHLVGYRVENDNSRKNLFA